MLDVTLLGTGGTMPRKGRFLTSLLARANGRAVLIDCGEGTQVALRAAGATLRHLDLLCLTHFHADHVSGLPGLLLSLGLEGRREPLLIAGPRGVREVVESLRVIAPVLPFETRYRELSEKEETLSAAGLEITAFAVSHIVPCYGFALKLPRAGKFDADAARAAEIPMKVWGLLQKSERVEYEGKVYEQRAVLGPPRRGIKLVYCTDTRPCEALTHAAKDADLLICEGMYGDDEKLPKALQTRHMLFSEAGRTAKEAGARRLWLTHFSPSMPCPEEYLSSARAFFPGAVCARDGEHTDLNFEEGEAP